MCAQLLEGSCLPVFSVPFALQLVLLCFSMFSCAGDQTQELVQARQALSHTELHLQPLLVLEFLSFFFVYPATESQAPVAGELLRNASSFSRKWSPLADFEKNPISLNGKLGMSLLFATKRSICTSFYFHLWWGNSFWALIAQTVGKFATMLNLLGN